MIRDAGYRATRGLWGSLRLWSRSEMIRDAGYRATPRTRAGGLEGVSRSRRHSRENSSGRSRGELAPSGSPLALSNSRSRAISGLSKSASRGAMGCRFGRMAWRRGQSSSPQSPFAGWRGSAPRTKGRFSGAARRGSRLASMTHSHSTQESLGWIGSLAGGRFGSRIRGGAPE